MKRHERSTQTSFAQWLHRLVSIIFEIKNVTLFFPGFNFAEVIASVQKHRPSRCYAAYELLNKKFMKGNTPPKKVSLQKVREELEKAKSPSLGTSESDSGFENKSSSSETELNKNNKNNSSTTKQQQHQPTKVTTLPRRQQQVQRNNSSTLPSQKPINKPVR